MPFRVTSFFHASEVNSTELPYVRLIDLEAKYMQSTELRYTATGPMPVHTYGVWGIFWDS